MIKVSNNMRLRKNRILTLFISSIMVMTMLIPMIPMEVHAEQEAVSYIHRTWNGSKVVSETRDCTNYTVVTADMTTLGSAGQESWYVVKDKVTSSGTIEVKGNVNLILADGAKLYTSVKGNNSAIYVSKDCSLTIYGQTGDSGVLEVYCDSSKKVIYLDTGAGMTINGGTVKSKNEGSPADRANQSFYGSKNNTLTINGGSVTAISEQGNAIQLINGSNTSMNVNGGSLVAEGKNSGISCDGTLTFNGGLINATGNTAAGMWSKVLKINGGNITGFTDANKKGLSGDTIYYNGSKNNIEALNSKEMQVISGTTENDAKVITQNSERSKYVKVKYSHNFTYSAEGAVIKATCSNDTCSLEGKKVTLRLEAPTLNTYGQTGTGISERASITGLTDFKIATDKDIDAADIKYYAATKSGDSYTKTGNALSAAPVNAGDYVAEFTVEGATASVGYSIAKTSGSISYTTTEVNKTYGNDAFTNELTNTGDGAVTYASDNTAVATVDSSTGAVTIAAAGKANITATVTDGSNYAYETKTASYRLTVNKASTSVTEPTVEAIIYNPDKTLSDITLADGWSWVDGTIVPPVGVNSYDVKIAVDDKNYDYTSIEGYDENTHTVTRTISLTVYSTDAVSYVDRYWDGSAEKIITVEKACPKYMVVAADMTALGSDGQETWYFVKDNITIRGTIEVKGNVNLILADGAKLYTSVKGSNSAIYVPKDCSLTIYGQSGDSGKLEVYSDSYKKNVYLDTGAGMTINGGIVTVVNEGIENDLSTEDYPYQGIFGVNNNSLTINGGIVTVTSKQGNAIQFNQGNGVLTVNGGSLTAKGNISGISCDGTLTYNGGLVNVTGHTAAGSWSEVLNINGGNITGFTDADKYGLSGETIYYNNSTDMAALNSKGLQVISGETANDAKVIHQNSERKNYVKVRYMHNFTYSAEGAVITATCSDDTCYLEGKKVTLRLEAPTLKTYGQTGTGISERASLTGLVDFKIATDQDIDVTDIKYYAATKRGDSYTKTGKALSAAPVNAGDYVAEITVEGATASVGYSIAKASGSISYAKTKIKKRYGNDSFTNELTNTGDGAVTYASDNTAVAKVDASTGVVTVTGVGKAEITATVKDGSNYTYAVKTASYTLIVKGKKKVVSNWTKVDTGEGDSILPWAVMMILASAAILIILRKRTR